MVRRGLRVANFPTRYPRPATRDPRPLVKLSSSHSFKSEMYYRLLKGLEGHHNYYNDVTLKVSGSVKLAFFISLCVLQFALQSRIVNKLSIGLKRYQTLCTYKYYVSVEGACRSSDSSA